MRGTRQTARGGNRAGRFIPASAGNTWRGAVAATRRAVHPRVCGEHARRFAAVTVSAGSSPRVRGTLYVDRIAAKFVRFIPACAGNTKSLHIEQLGQAVHPRVCGEHIASSRGFSMNRGSSPRVRGTRAGDNYSPLIVRFIPACAGNTASSSGMSGAPAVHPRVCGEHCIRSSSPSFVSGSSPRVRGTLNEF